MKTCPVCHKEFQPKRSTKNYCSDYCRVVAFKRLRNGSPLATSRRNPLRKDRIQEAIRALHQASQEICGQDQ
jgi:hypothetical protein